MIEQAWVGSPTRQGTSFGLLFSSLEGFTRASKLLCVRHECQTDQLPRTSEFAGNSPRPADQSPAPNDTAFAVGVLHVQAHSMFAIAL